MSACRSSVSRTCAVSSLTLVFPNSRTTEWLLVWSNVDIRFINNNCQIDFFVNLQDINVLKVARIEQTETPDMMQERVKQMKKSTKFDKVVSREICQVTNRGTQVFGQQVPLTNSHQANYMLAVVEKVRTSLNCMS